MMREKIRLIKKAGIRVKGLLMMGLPGETEASISRSKDYVFSLPIDDFNLAKFTPFPGSPIYKQINEAGEAWGPSTKTGRRWTACSFQFIPRGMTQASGWRSCSSIFTAAIFKRPKVICGLCDDALEIAGQLAALRGQLLRVRQVCPP